jgi:hypothetical protein
MRLCRGIASPIWRHFLKGVHENVMFPPDAVRLSERLKAGPGKPDRRRTPPVTGEA